ncbi:MAG: GNAT family N-acetyltransferase, partial [Bacteroidales bacterium]|nr:GNAT family N-acetyltransferase [Bacteroidales bacterium]
MADLEIRNITHPEDPALKSVEKLFRDMYEHIKDKGLKTPLVSDGEKIWMKSVKKTLDRFGAVIVAEENGEVIGFVHGLIRFMPDFLGGEKMGFVTHQHIEPEHRNKGLGKKLMRKLEEWFFGKGIRQIELQA